MTIDWTDEALLAAMKTLYPGKPGRWEDADDLEGMRAALDAAVKAQGLVDKAAAERFTKAHGDLCRKEGRAEALEEAENAVFYCLSGMAALRAIRAIIASPTVKS
jgi:hypothetical protein